MFSCSVVSDSLRHHGLQPARLPCPWDAPGKDPGVGCHALLQGIAQGTLLNALWSCECEGTFKEGIYGYMDICIHTGVGCHFNLQFRMLMHII